MDVTKLTLGFLIHGFWIDRESPIWGVWAAPAAPKALSNGGARIAPSFLEGFGAAQTTQINAFWSARKPCTKNASV